MSSQPNSFRRFLRQMPLVILLMATGCTEYWWHRGQPPSVDTLLLRSESNLSKAQEDFSPKRADVSAAFKEIDSSLNQVVGLIKKDAEPANVQPQLDALASQFISLEGKLSIGSRAAYGELSGQLRAFIEDNAANKRSEFYSFGLFAARTKNFLASELSVPPPVL